MKNHKQSHGYIKVVQTTSNPKYKYLALGKDIRIKPHKKKTYPKRGVFRANFGPIIDVGSPDKRKLKSVQMESKNFKGNEKEIAQELIMLGFSRHGNIFVKDNKYYIDLKRKEVKRKQMSFPKDTKIPFKKIVISTSLDRILPKGYLCDYTLKLLN